MKRCNSFNINKKEIDFVQTLMCGQIFSYKQFENKILVLSGDKQAEVFEFENYYKVITDDIEYFKNFFDLKNDYEKIKQKLILQGGEILAKAIEFGRGIRILKQDLLEVIVSFVFSANNNIKRITASLFALRNKYGTKLNDNFSAFPTLKQLGKINENEFKELGAGYRSAQLVKLITQLKELELKNLEKLDTEELRKKLISLSGIGPKVADCILLFGFARTDVFPVDTWIKKVFNLYYGKSDNINQIRKILIDKFGELSGYAQQYLFYYQRSCLKV